jgi:pimeloyl-ACP methyl ester carboxylesterase
MIRSIWKTRRRATFSGLFLVYTFSMLFGGCANRFILFPSRQFIDAGSAKQVYVEGPEKRKVETWVDRSPGAASAEPQAYVIEFTGNATRAEQIATYSASLWGDHPVELWAVNYPGYGQSSGDAALRDIPSAALAVYDHVAAIAKGKPIYLAGNSLGTTAALYLATQRPTAGLLLQNPPAIRSLILSNFGWWNLWLLAGPVAMDVPKELDSPTNAARVTAPAIFVLASDDTFVVPENQLKVVNAFKGPKQIVHTTGGHNDGMDAAAHRQLIQSVDWLVRTSSETAAAAAQAKPTAE